MENYEQRYKEALERAKCMHEQGMMPERLEYVFPELKRVRKAILELVKQSSDILNPKNQKSMIDWLEKQGERKQHFELKAGHWYICHSAYCCRADHLTVKEGERFMCEKDGVVKGFVIKDPEKYFKEVCAPAPIEDEQKPAEWSEEDEQNLNTCLGYIPDEFLRSWLMDVIHVKYEKSTNKVEPKFKVGDNIRRKTPSFCDKDMQVARIDKDYYVCNHIGKFSSEVVPFLEQSSYKLIDQKPAWCEKDEYVFSKVLDWMLIVNPTSSIFEKLPKEQFIERFKSLKERVQPKQEWSEEDEETLDYIIDYIENNKSHDKIYTKKTEILEGMIDWLESIKERYSLKAVLLTPEEIKKICTIYDNLKQERECATVLYNSDETFFNRVLMEYKLIAQKGE